MEHYRRAWQVVTLLVAGTGVVAAVIFAPPVPVAVAGMVGVTLGWCVGLHRHERSGRSALQDVLGGAGLGAAAVLAIAGSWAVLGLGGTAAVAGLIAVGSPPVAFRVERHLRHQDAAAVDAPQVPAAVPGTDLECRPVDDLPDAAALSDAELCLAWRRSYTLLQGARLPERRSAVVHARVAYLDELERRHPDAFRSWMADGARACSDPARYLDAGNT